MVSVQQNGDAHLGPPGASRVVLVAPVAVVLALGTSSGQGSPGSIPKWRGSKRRPRRCHPRARRIRHRGADRTRWLAARRRQAFRGGRCWSSSGPNHARREPAGAKSDDHPDETLGHRTEVADAEPARGRTGGAGTARSGRWPTSADSLIWPGPNTGIGLRPDPHGFRHLGQVGVVQARERRCPWTASPPDPAGMVALGAVDGEGLLPL